MALIETIWTQGHYIPKKDLIAWHAADTTNTASAVDDASGNGRHMTCASSQPAFLTNVINGLPAIEWDGTDNPLAYSGTVFPYHAFVVACYTDTAFPAGDLGNGGLLTGVTAGDILVANVSSTRFFDFDYEALGTYKYRRRDVQFAENDLQSSFNNAMSIFEVSLTSGYTLDGIQVGQQRNITARKWKGRWCEQLIYGRVLAEQERLMIYEYLAMKYLLWRRVASGLDVFPFQPNWQYALTADKLVLSSTAVSGSVKARSKSSAKISYDLRFENRWQPEYDATRSFWDLKYPGTSFIYRDDAFSPARDTEVLFASPMSSNRTDTHDFDYALAVTQI